MRWIGMSDEDMSDVDATNYPQQDLLDTRAQLEDRLQKALTSIDSYQDERFELLDKIIQLRLRLQNFVDILEK